MELKDTVELMTSDDWKDRFKAEYLQTKIRYEKLHKMIIMREVGKCPFNTPISLESWRTQLNRKNKSNNLKRRKDFVCIYYAM